MKKKIEPKSNPLNLNFCMSSSAVSINLWVFTSSFAIFEYLVALSFHPPTTREVFNFGFIFFNSSNLPRPSEIS